jgi:hypothetical protein
MWWSLGWVVFAAYWFIIPRLQVADLGLLAALIGALGAVVMALCWLRGYWDARAPTR